MSTGDLPDEENHVKTALARACRPNSQTADQADDLRVQLREIRLRRYIDAEMAKKPPFSPEQIGRLRALFDRDPS